MATRDQISANQRNARLSKGPRDTIRTRFNGLKHGLRAEEVLLPGEDPAAFEAERQAWVDDWKPRSHTRAVLVERAAVASWKLRRAVRSEAALYARLVDDAGRNSDLDQAARVDRALDRFEDDPMAALMLLESHAAGLDRLLVSRNGLVEALAAGPTGWDQPLYYQRLMILLGHRADAVPIEAGPVPVASARLLRSNASAEVIAPLGLGRPVPMTAADAGAAFAAIRAEVESEVARLRERRASAADPAEGRRRAMEAASADMTKEAQLRHRYEMAHEQSLRSAIRQLLALAKSGADLPDEAEAEAETAPEAVAATVVAEALRKSNLRCENSKTCEELASVGATALEEACPRQSSGTPKRPGRGLGGDPGSKRSLTRS